MSKRIEYNKHFGPKRNVGNELVQSVFAMVSVPMWLRSQEGAENLREKTSPTSSLLVSPTLTACSIAFGTGTTQMFYVPHSNHTVTM